MSNNQLVIVSPYEPLANGIADYVAELVPFHAQDYDIVLCIADHHPRPVIDDARVTVLHAGELRNRTDLAGVPHIYHIGNNPDHIYAIQLLVERPGLVVLHDFCLSYLLEMASQEIGSWDIYRSWAQHDYGVFAEKLVDDFLAKGWRGRFMSYELALNGALLAHATGLVVHSRYSQFKAAARCPGLPVHYIPHHVSDRAFDARAIGRNDARRALGLPQDTLIISALGFVTRPKLIDRALASLARIRHLVPDFRLVIAGEKRPHEYDVDADIAASGLQDRVISTGYLSEDDFYQHVAAADVVLNMRFPVGGESSGTLARAIGCGRACVVLDHGPMGEMPSHAVAKVPFGKRLDEELDQILIELLSNPEKRHELEVNARAVSSPWTAQASVERYHAILRAMPKGQAPRPIATTVYGRGRDAAREILAQGHDKTFRDEASLWWRYPVVPDVAPGASVRILCVDDLGRSPDILRQAFGLGEQAIDVITQEELTAASVGDWRACDAAVILLDAANLHDPARIWSALAGRLRWGASVVLEVFNTDRLSPQNGNLVESGLAALGCMGRHVFAIADMAPELEGGLDRRVAMNRSVGMGQRSSAFMALPRGADATGHFSRVPPVDATWILDRIPV